MSFMRNNVFLKLEQYLNGYFSVDDDVGSKPYPPEYTLVPFLLLCRANLCRNRPS